jgi:hypothetical protein
MILDHTIQHHGETAGAMVLYVVGEGGIGENLGIELRYIRTAKL